MLDDTSRMTRHALISWIDKKGKNLSVSGVYTEYDRMYCWPCSTKLRVNVKSYYTNNRVVVGKEVRYKTT
jgi:hypothetical protein